MTGGRENPFLVIYPSLVKGHTLVSPVSSAALLTVPQNEKVIDFSCSPKDSSSTLNVSPRGKQTEKEADKCRAIAWWFCLLVIKRKNYPPPSIKNNAPFQECSLKKENKSFKKLKLQSYLNKARRQ